MVRDTNYRAATRNGHRKGGKVAPVESRPLRERDSGRRNLRKKSPYFSEKLSSRRGPALIREKGNIGEPKGVRLKRTISEGACQLNGPAGKGSLLSRAGRGKSGVGGKKGFGLPAGEVVRNTGWQVSMALCLAAVGEDCRGAREAPSILRGIYGVEGWKGSVRPSESAMGGGWGR